MSLKIVLEREVHVKVGNDETLETVRISCFMQDEMAVCTCSLPGIDAKDRPNYGTDMLQAICLTVEYAKERISNAKKNGIVVWWVDRDDCGGFML